MTLPVERRRAVVGKLLARKLLVDALRKSASQLKVGLGALHPQQVRVGRVGVAAAEYRLDSWSGAIETLARALARQEWLVTIIHIVGNEVGGERVGARDDDGRHARDIGGEPRGVEGANVLRGGNQHLAAHVAALLLRRELVFPVHARGARFDHR